MQLFDGGEEKTLWGQILLIVLSQYSPSISPCDNNLEKKMDDSGRIRIL